MCRTRKGPTISCGSFSTSSAERLAPEVQQHSTPDDQPAAGSEQKETLDAARSYRRCFDQLSGGALVTNDRRQVVVCLIKVVEKRACVSSNKNGLLLAVEDRVAHQRSTVCMFTGFYLCTLRGGSKKTEQTTTPGSISAVTFSSGSRCVSGRR